MADKFKVDLNGKVAVVTGGSGALGRSLANALAEAGADVAIANRNRESGNEIAQQIQTVGGKAIAVSCDVLNSESLEQANTEVENALGPVDILINGAGGNHPGGTTTCESLQPEELLDKKPDIRTFYDLTPEDIQFVFNLNFMGTLLATQAFTKRMVRRESGTVINISSMTAFTPLTKIPAYSGAKAAVNNFTRWLAVHLAPSGIRVNAIAPGFFLATQNRALLLDDDGELTPRGRKITEHTPMKRFGKPNELQGTLLWLACDDASGFVTGTVIPVDGGFNAYSGV